MAPLYFPQHILIVKEFAANILLVPLLDWFGSHLSSSDTYDIVYERQATAIIEPVLIALMRYETGERDIQHE
jgi:hypothetical protein